MHQHMFIINTPNMTNSTLVSQVKMEYGWNFSIFGLKMMMKSGLGKIFLKFLHALTIFITEFVLLIKISPIFHLSQGHQSWICHILCVRLDSDTQILTRLLWRNCFFLSKPLILLLTLLWNLCIFSNIFFRRESENMVVTS